MKSLKGHYNFESSNTLRNSVRPISIVASSERFKVDKRGSHFAEFSTVASTLAGHKKLSSGAICYLDENLGNTLLTVIKQLKEPKMTIDVNQERNGRPLW